MPRQGKKKLARLEARQKEYDTMVSFNADRKSQFVRPGSNKKSH